MKKRISVLLLVCLLSAALGGCAGAQEKAVIIPPEASPETGGDSTGDEATVPTLSFFGAWEIMDYQSAEDASLSAEEAEALRGTSVTYQQASVLINDEKAAEGFSYKTDGPSYDYDSLIDAYSANLGEWWNNVGAVTCIVCDSDAEFFGDRFFTVDEDTIWIYHGGVFFLAKSVDG